MQKEQPKAQVLSEADLARIMALPTRELTYAGSLCQGKYDKETERFYLLKEEDGELKLDGRVMRVRPQPPQAETPIPPSPAPEDPEEEESPEEPAEAPTEEETLSAEGDAEEEAPKEKSSRISQLQQKVKKQTASPQPRKKSDKKESKKPERKFKFRIPDNLKEPKQLLMIAGMVVAFCFIFYNMFFGGKDRTQDPTPPPSQGPAQTSTVPDGETQTTPPSLDIISVIQLTRDLIPGERITDDDIQEAPISAETYNQIYLGAHQLYQWSRSESLLGSYVTTYIPQGQYLTYQNVATAYIQEPNPWRLENGVYQYVTIPLAVDSAMGDLNYGNVVNMTVRKQSVNEVSTPSDQPEEPSPSVPGIDHQTTVQQSYVVDTYGLSNIVICDLLDSKGKSLYPTYTALIEIPTGERMTYIREKLKKDPEWQVTLFPAKAVIRLTNEQAGQLGSLEDPDTTIKYTDAGWRDEDSETKIRYAAEAKSLMQTITEAISLNEREAAEEARDK